MIDALGLLAAGLLSLLLVGLLADRMLPNPYESPEDEDPHA